LAECLGILFKTHKEHCRELVETLRTAVLPAAAQDGTKHKQKMLLFILDDMVEFLGPDFLGPLYPEVCAQIIGYSTSQHSAIRQASVYGIGMIAQHGGGAFPGVSQQCLQGIRAAIEFPMDAATKEKKGKLT
jgi:importin-5|tara:strand:- start:496 stop:891 length:396 start_codon:yes stop_codon:yes gene_type:complete